MEDEIYFFTLPQTQYGQVNATIREIEKTPERFFQAGDIAWMLTASMLVFMMVLGLSFLYCGTVDRRLSLQMAWLPLMTAALVGAQWYLWGYAITFSNWPSSGTFWGGTDGIAFHNVLARPVPAHNELSRDGPMIPELLYALYQGMFASFTAALVSGAAASKDRPGHFLVFILFWSTLVYDPIARWSWSPEGWSNKRGSLDFAGGTAVHITAGSSVLAHGIFYVSILPKIESLLESVFGSRSDDSLNGTLQQNGHATTNPAISADSNNNNAGTITATAGAPTSHHDTHRLPQTEAGAIGQTNVILGSLFLWLGWFGFNGGSALGANLRAVSACMCTHLAACSGGVTFCLMSAVVEYIWPEADSERADQNNTRQRTARYALKPIKFSIVDFCNGAIIGLVCVTPAAGFVPHQVAPVFGIVGAAVCFGAMQTPLSDIVADMHYIFIVHGVGGLVGMILTGFLARGQVSALDGISSVERNRGGWDGRWIQIGRQLMDACAGLAYAFAMTMAILVVLEPFMFFARRGRRRIVVGLRGERIFVQDRDILSGYPLENLNLPPLTSHNSL